MALNINEKVHQRIYVCHTYYHVYVSVLKELNLPKTERGNADMVLSSLCTKFGELKERLAATGLFKNVYEFDEKRENFFPELMKYKVDRKNLFINMFQRIIFTRKFAKAQEPFIPTNFSLYKDIYVFCDCDPIGVYLSQHKIYFHAVEDGLNSRAVFNRAKYNDPSAWKIKRFMSMYLNLIYLCEGNNKYCLDMEVNDVSLISEPFKKIRSVSRDELAGNLSDDDKRILLMAFVTDLKGIEDVISRLGPEDETILILTEDLCDLETRKRIFTDIIDMYKEQGIIFIKPHPRDVFDYRKNFPEIPVFDALFPMEILNLFPGLHFKKAITIFTPLHDIKFADEKVFLGKEFMDKYEDPKIHEYHRSAGKG